MSPSQFQVGQSVFIGSDGVEIPRGTKVVIEMTKPRQGSNGWRYWVVPSRHIGPDGRVWIDEEMLSSEEPGLQNQRPRDRKPADA